MPTLLRSAAIIILGIGLLGGFVLVVLAQPSPPANEVNRTLLIYGLAAMASGIVWGGTWWALANALEMGRHILDYLHNGEAHEQNGAHGSVEKPEPAHKNAKLSARTALGIVLIIVGISAAAMIIIASL